MKRSYWLLTLGTLLTPSLSLAKEDAASLIEKIPAVSHILPTQLPPMMSYDPSIDKAESRFSNTIGTLPLKHGTITKVPGKKKVSREIIVVQDIRLDTQAQKTLQTALKALISDKKATVRTTRTTPYMNTAATSSDPRKNVAFIKTQISEMKNRLFNNKLEAFDVKVQMFHQGHMSMASYVEVLTNMKNRSLGPITATPQIDFFKKIQPMEAKIDFPTVEKERAQVIRRLVYRLAIQDQQTLRKMILAYRLGDIPHHEFYSYLQAACVKTGIKFESYSALNAYAQYVRLSDQLEPRKFFTELKILEEQRYNGLIIKPEERALVKQSLSVNAMAQLADMASTSGEWAWSKNTNQ